MVSDSAPKLWMIRMPERSSCTKAFKLEDFFRWICHLSWEWVWMYQIPAAIRGRLIRAAAASLASLTNMMTATALMVMKSGIRVVTQLESTSFKELMSPMMRARIFPVGRLSKN